MGTSEKRPRRRLPAPGSSLSLVIGFLLLTMVVLTIGVIFRLAGAYQHRLWDLAIQSQMTVVVTSDPPVIVSYRSDTKEAIIMPLPKNFEVTAGNDLGNWRVESLNELGKQKGVGGRLLTSTLQNVFGIPIDGYLGGQNIEWLGYQQSSDIRTGSSFTTIPPKVLWSSFWPGDTNFTVFDTLRLAFLSTTATKRVVLPEDVGIVKRVELPSGELGWEPDNDISQTQLARDFADHVISEEQVAVGITNATTKGGLGRRVATIIETLGGQVVWLKTEGNMEGRCTVFYEEQPVVPKTARRLSKLFDCSLTAKEGLSSRVELTLGSTIATEFPRQN